MIKESKAQTDRRGFLASFFIGAATLRKTSVGTPAVLAQVPESGRAFTTPVQGGKTINQKQGGEGAMIVNDCDGAEIFRLEWKQGLITTEGESTIEAGCDGETSSPA